MQPDDRNAAYLWDMMRAAREAEEMMGDRDLAAFLTNRVLLRAIERSVEIIGEAARRVSPRFMAAHPEIPWREVIGQRDILAHEYGQIAPELLYETVVKDIPDLIRQIHVLLPPPEDDES